MISRTYFITVTIFCMAFASLSARAEVVILKTGKKIEAEKVWREESKVWVLFQGMRASIPQSKVERIESESNDKPGEFNPREAENADLRKKTRLTLSEPPPGKTKLALQTASKPPLPKLKKDFQRVFPDGSIGDLRWGSPISAIKDLEKIQDAGGLDGVAEYRREKENLKFGQAALSSIHYAFWRDRLFMVTLRTKGHSNYTALREEVFRQYGQGIRADHGAERYLWTEASCDMMLQYSKDGQQGLWWLRSSDIDRQYKLSQISGHASYLRWMKSRN